MARYIVVAVVTSFLITLTNGERLHDPLVEFHLLRKDCVAANALFSDKVESDLLGGLKRDVERTTCLKGNGITSVPDYSQGKAALASVGDIARTLPLFRGSELSLEFWVRSNDSMHSETSILAFGTRNTVNKYAVRIDQRPLSSSYMPGRMHVKARNRADSVLVLESSRLVKDIYSHVVIDLQYMSPMFAGKKFSMISENTTVNATAPVSSIDGSFSGSYDMALWDPSFVLQFFTTNTKTVNQFSENFWSGELLFFAMYNKSMSMSDIKGNYEAGLPNSVPVVWSETVHINEDGQRDLSTTIGEEVQPLVYHNGIPLSDISVIQIPVFDVDDTKEHPNYYLHRSPGGRHKYSVAYITKLPARGILYVPLLAMDIGSNFVELNITEWVEVTEVPWPVHLGIIDKHLVSNPMDDISGPLEIGGGNFVAGYFVKFRPIRDQHSTNGTIYAEFEINAIDSKTSEHSIETATVGITVTALNDPPVADNVTADVYAMVAQVLTLSGSDIDSSIGGALIFTIPEHGRLYQVYANGSISFEHPIVPQTQLWGLAVAYVYMGTQNQTLSEFPQYIARDRFEFQLFDSVIEHIGSFHLTSQLGFASIFVSPSIYATEQEEVTGQEATAMVIPIRGVDLSGSGRALYVEITDIPDYGRLFDCITGFELTIGSVLSHALQAGVQKSYSQPVNVSYVGNPFYFSLPKSRYNHSIIAAAVSDQFSFRLKTLDNSYSPTVGQRVAIRNRNHETNVSFIYPGEKDQFVIYQLSPDAEDSKYKSKIEISGFLLSDKDQDTNLMRLSISTLGGLIDLNPAHVGRLTFNGYQFCHEEQWECQGRGIYDSNIDAVGTASDISNALNGMVFRSTISPYMDIINVTIYDGSGGECLSVAAMDLQTVQTGCHKSTTSIAVEVQPIPSYFDVVDPGLLTDRYVPITYIFLLAMVCIVCCLLCICFKCCKKQEDKYLKAGIVIPAHIRRRRFQFNLCSDCGVHPVTFAFTRKKSKKSKIDRVHREYDVESQISLDDVNIEVEGHDNDVPACHWVRCESGQKKSRNNK